VILSKKTQQILKNFATINTNLLVREGNTLRTIAVAKDVFAVAQIEETFDREFAIYDLTSLLALLSLEDDLELEFGEKSLTLTKSIAVDSHFSFMLTKEELNTIEKAAKIVQAPFISFVSTEGKVVLTVGDPKTPASNSFTKPIGLNENEDFNVLLSVQNLKVIPSDYQVILSKKKFVHFKNEDESLCYWLSASPDSVI
jgi:hypothetical protein